MQLHLRDGRAVGAEGFGIDVGSHMQNHGVVGAILMVVMAFPVGSMYVDFYISHPQNAVYLDFRIEKVGSCIGIGESGVNDFHGLSLRGMQRSERKKLVFPYKLE